LLDNISPLQISQTLSAKFLAMHIITRKRLNEFAVRHPAAASGLAHWYHVLKRNHPSNFAELRRLFPHADQVGGLTVFNIGGNKARLVAAIHYNRNKVYIRAVLTHAEYDTGKWKAK
jgi:mRNA interferase HigB